MGRIHCNTRLNKNKPKVFTCNTVKVLPGFGKSKAQRLPQSNHGIFSPWGRGLSPAKWQLLSSFYPWVWGPGKPQSKVFEPFSIVHCGKKCQGLQTPTKTEGLTPCYEREAELFTAISKVIFLGLGKGSLAHPLVGGTAVLLQPWWYWQLPLSSALSCLWKCNGFSTIFCKDCPSFVGLLFHLSKNHLAILLWVNSGFSILFQLSICLSLADITQFLIIVAM